MSDDREPEAGEASPRGPGHPGSWTPPPAGPPGSGIFSLEGRPAAGLYSLAWLLAVVAIGLVVVAVAAASGAAAGRPAGAIVPVMLAASGLAFTLCFAAAAGYQVVARADRRPDRYRGPSPLILFGFILFGVTLLVGLLSAAGVVAPESQPVGTLAVELITALGYVAGIWLFVVRTSALTWHGMGWPRPGDALRRLPGDVAAGLAVILPIYTVTVFAGGLLAVILGVSLPAVLPAPRSPVDDLATILTGVVVAPIGEEIFFRGLALTAWWRDRSLRSALLRATIFFAAAHILNVTASSAGEGLRIAFLQFVVILPVGYALGWLFSQRGILASIAGHMTFNGIAVALLLLLPGR